MIDDRPKRESMSLEEAMTLNILRLAALIEEQERLLKPIRERAQRGVEVLKEFPYRTA